MEATVWLCGVQTAHSAAGRKPPTSVALLHICRSKHNNPIAPASFLSALATVTVKALLLKHAEMGEGRFRPWERCCQRARYSNEMQMRLHIAACDSHSPKTPGEPFAGRMERHDCGSVDTCGRMRYPERTALLLPGESHFSKCSLTSKGPCS